MSHCPTRPRLTALTLTPTALSGTVALPHVAQSHCPTWPCHITTPATLHCPIRPRRITTLGPSHHHARPAALPLYLDPPHCSQLCKIKRLRDLRKAAPCAVAGWSFVSGRGWWVGHMCLQGMASGEASDMCEMENPLKCCWFFAAAHHNHRQTTTTAAAAATTNTYHHHHHRHRHGPRTNKGI